MQHTPSPDDVYRMARADVERYGRITMITQAIIEARGGDACALERRLLAARLTV